MPDAELIAKMSQPEYHYPGLEGSLESLEWLWDTGFAAVAGDNPGFEAWCKYWKNVLQFVIGADKHKLRAWTIPKSSSACMRRYCLASDFQSVNYSTSRNWRKNARSRKGGHFSWQVSRLIWLGVLAALRMRLQYYNEMAGLNLAFLRQMFTQLPSRAPSLRPG